MANVFVLLLKMMEEYSLILRFLSWKKNIKTVFSKVILQLAEQIKNNSKTLA